MQHEQPRWMTLPVIMEDTAVTQTRNDARVLMMKWEGSNPKYLIEEPKPMVPQSEDTLDAEIEKMLRQTMITPYRPCNGK